MTPRIALISAFLVTSLLPTAAFADQSPRVFHIPAPVYKDLPGVKPQKSIVESSDNGDCKPATLYRRFDRRDVFPDLPVAAWRCEKDGVTYTGTQLPNRPWVPGLNPYDLPH